MDRQTRYPKEVRERAVRLVFEHEREHPSQWAAISSISAKLGMTPETLRKWIRRAEIAEGLRGGLTSSERERVKQLERENRELRRANEILKAAAVFVRGGARPPRQQMTTFIDELRIPPKPNGRSTASRTVVPLQAEHLGEWDCDWVADEVADRRSVRRFVSWVLTGGSSLVLRS